jgi:hypothetical protein
MIIGKAITVGGNGGIPCTLVIATAAGATVTATLNGITISTTANGSGVATLELEKEGAWTVTAEQNGLSDSIEIVVEHTFHVTLYLLAPLYIYTSGDSTFQNCTWTDPEDMYINFPPFSDIEGQITDHVRLRYFADDQLNGGSTIGFYYLKLETETQGYKKLCIEAMRETKVGGGVVPLLPAVGFSVTGEDPVYEPLQGDEASVYEFDISKYSQINNICFRLNDNISIYVYNIWLE